MQKLKALYDEFVTLINDNHLGTLIVSSNVGAQMKSFYDFQELSNLEKMSLKGTTGEIIIGKFMDHIIVVSEILNITDTHVYVHGYTEETQNDYFAITTLKNVDEF